MGDFLLLEVHTTYLWPVELLTSENFSYLQETSLLEQQ